MNRELQGDTLVVRIPMRFKRQGGRKRILAPDVNDLARDRPAPNRMAHWPRPWPAPGGGSESSTAACMSRSPISPPLRCSARAESAISRGWRYWRRTIFPSASGPSRISPTPPRSFEVANTSF